MLSTALAQIDLTALADNLSKIKQLMPRQKILPMIKANGYGHGLEAVARVLADESALGVAHVSEALQLRKAGIKTPLVVMHGFIDADEMMAFVNDSTLIANVYDAIQITLLEQLARQTDHQVHVWLKVDTGMNRLGFLPAEIQTIYQKLCQLSSVASVDTIFTHLADADNDDQHFTHQQIATFNEALNGLPVSKSVLNSAGILSNLEAAFDWIRPGITLYGASPFLFNSASYQRTQIFQPVMTFTAYLIAIKRVLPGEVIGYGCTFRATQEMRIGVVGAGYGDGYPRLAKTGTPVLIQNKRCPIVGRVSMDLITVDVSRLPAVKVGEPVVLWGNGLPVDEIAHGVGTIPYELLVQVTRRVAVENVNGSSTLSLNKFLENG